VDVLLLLYSVQPARPRLSIIALVKSPPRTEKRRKRRGFAIAGLRSSATKPALVLRSDVCLTLAANPANFRGA